MACYSKRLLKLPPFWEWKVPPGLISKPNKELSPRWKLGDNSHLLLHTAGSGVPRDSPAAIAWSVSVQKVPVASRVPSVQRAVVIIQKRQGFIFFQITRNIHPWSGWWLTLCCDSADGWNISPVYCCQSTNKNIHVMISSANQLAAVCQT